MNTPLTLSLAPMATLSHEGLRLLIHKYKDPDEYFSEMIHAPSFLTGGKFESWYVRTAPSPEKIVWQLTGPKSEAIVAAAKLIIPIGGIGIDINMGCSAPDIVKTGAGIAWMKKSLNETRAMVHSVSKVIHSSSAYMRGSKECRLSVKLRLGEDDDYERFYTFCQMLVEEGVSLITLHPRTRREKMTQIPRYSFISALAKDLKIPIYGNGCITSVSDIHKFQSNFPCAGVMIGRAAVQKPWIFAQNAGNLITVDHLENAVFFLEALITSQPQEFHLTRARRFFFYYCDNFTFSHHIKMRIQNAKNPDHIRVLLEQYFSEVPEDRYKL